MKNRGSIAVIWILLGSFIFSSHLMANEEAEKAAVAASAKWLALVDKGEYPKSWDETAELFKTMVTKNEWQARLNTYRLPLGKVSERKVTSKEYKKSLPNAPDGEYVVLQYETLFTNKLTVIETIASMLEKKKWKVAGYYITFPGQEPQPSGEKK